MTITAPPRAATAFTNSSFVAQAVRYLVVGSCGMALYLGVYALLAVVFPVIVANALAWFSSTVVCNRAHRRITFGVSGSESAKADSAAAMATSVLGLVLSSVAVALVPDSDPSLQVLVLFGGTAVGGAARFVLLRWWLGRHR